MAETINIAKIAEIVSCDLFGVFSWTRNKITNSNWKCGHLKDHNTRSGTHSTDAVWYYDEPYENKRTYIQADLKSYARNTINKATLQTSLNHLAMAVDCAPDSPEWRNNYLLSEEGAGGFQVVGLLFIYNHDGDFDSSFSSLLMNACNGTVFKMKPSTRLMVMGPKQIWELYSIASHIKQLNYDQSEKLIRTPFYPEGKIRQFRRLSSETDVATTIDTLFSDVISFKVKPESYDGDCQHLHVYYRGMGATKEEFLHLIDSFFRYQTIETAKKIFIHHIVVDGASDVASANFERARNEIAELYKVGTNKLDSLEFETLPFVKPRFSATEIGMRS